AKAISYARKLAKVPQRTLVIVVSDFDEGFAIEDLIAEVRALVESGVHPLGLAALDDAGKARYCAPVAELVVSAGMPIAALTPLERCLWLDETFRKHAG